MRKGLSRSRRYGEREGGLEHLEMVDHICIGIFDPILHQRCCIFLLWPVQSHLNKLPKCKIDGFTGGGGVLYFGVVPINQEVENEEIHICSKIGLDPLKWLQFRDMTFSLVAR